MSIWDHLSFNNRFVELPQTFYSRVDPTPLLNPRWLAWNNSLATELGFPAVDGTQSLDDDLLNSLSGLVDNEHFDPIAMKYAGHQFGAYNPDLGDGRGLLLSQVVAKSGETFDLHLKVRGKHRIRAWVMGAP